MAAIAVGVALVACGVIAAQSSTATTALPPLAVTTQPCLADQMKALVDFSASRHAPHGTYVPIDLVNEGQQECLLRGYTPVTGVSTTAGDDAHAAHIEGAFTSVFLPPQYAAHTWLLITTAPGGKTAGCHQLTASGLRVAVPQSPGHLWIPWPFTACASSGQALLSIRPVLPGLANPAIFP